MVALERRQDFTAPPTGNGLADNTLSLSQSSATETAALGRDTAVAGTLRQSAPIASVTSTSTPTPLPTETTGPVSSSSSNDISLGTVIGSCVGAFVGAAILIGVAFFFYRRYSQTLKEKPRRRAHHPYQGDNNGAHSKSWNKLEDSEDHWEGKEKPAVAASAAVEVSEKTLPPPSDMFKKSPSTTSHTEENTTFEMRHPYSNPAATTSRVPETRDLIGREPQNLLGQIDSGPPIAWASATRLEGGAVSPSLAVAIPTPPAVKSQPHHWESAEVLNYNDGQNDEVTQSVASTERPSAKSNNPYKDIGGGSNPFFSGKQDAGLPRKRSSSKSSIYTTRSRSNSIATTRSRANSIATIQQSHINDSIEKEKGKERIVSIDPFKDPLPKPHFIQHNPSASASTIASNDRAIKHLIVAAGMDGLSEEEVQRRLKAVSMQASIISSSGDSMYTDADPDLDQAALRNHYVPPSSSGHA